MDVVKLKGRANKVLVGDCVSVPDDYFGKPFQKTLCGLGYGDGRIYGRVAECGENPIIFRSDGTSTSRSLMIISSGRSGWKTSTLPSNSSFLLLHPPSIQQQTNNNHPPFIQQQANNNHRHRKRRCSLMPTSKRICLNQALTVDGDDGMKSRWWRPPMYWTHPGVLVHNVPLSQNTSEVSHRRSPANQLGRLWWRPPS